MIVRSEGQKARKINRRQQIIIFYISLTLLIILGGLSMQKQGFSWQQYCYSLTLPTAQSAYRERQLLGQWFYFLTDIALDAPEGLLASVLPANRMGQIPIRRQLADVKGYFSQDENTYLTVEAHEAEQQKEPIASVNLKENVAALDDLSYVYQHYYTAPGKMDFGLDMLNEWQFSQLATKPIAMEATTKVPKVLIFHTHVREAYEGGATVADVGEALKQTLESQYGIGVLHDTTSFYEPTNTTSFPTSGEYERMEPVIRKILEKNPSIEVVIDLHRDGVNEGVHLTGKVDGKSAAKIMFVNGLCRHRNLDGKVVDKTDLMNPYLAENLAFSLQSQMTMNTLYPGLSRKIYLNEWRYSTHMKPYSLLLEWGAQTNTSEEALASVPAVAKVLATVLQED